MTPVKDGTDEKSLVSPTKTNESIQPQSFPIIGDRLNDEMFGISWALNDTRYWDNKISVAELALRRLKLNEMNQYRGVAQSTDASAIANLNDDMQILDPEYLASNKTTFTNNLGTIQTFTTLGFSQTVENSVSTTNTNSTGISTTVNSTFKIPFIASEDISVTAIYDYSNAKTVENKTTTSNLKR